MTWSEFVLGDAIKVEHGFAFKSEFFRPEGRLLVVTPGNFLEPGGFRVRPGKERYYAGDFPERYLLEKGDLVVAMTEQGEGLLGSAARIPANDGFLHNQRIGLVKFINPTLLEKRFTYWLFNSLGVRAQIRSSASGTKVRHTAPERIHKVRVRVPSVESQAQIAVLLDAYDDLIENNRRRIALLEESARLLYREWFIHLRFPGHETSDLRDGLPAGWSRRTIADLTSFLNRGISPAYNDDALGLVVNQKCIRSGLLNLKPARRQSKEVKPERFLQVGDVLINSTGAGTLGRVAVVRTKLSNCTVDTHVTIARPATQELRAFMAIAMLELEPVFAGMGVGSTNQLELARAEIGALAITEPPVPLQAAFHELVWPLLIQSETLSKSNERLAEARDALLPKLMSGEIAA